MDAKSASPSFIPGEAVLQTLLKQFAEVSDKAINAFLENKEEKTLSKFFKHGDDTSHLDQIFNSLQSVAEHSLPSLLKTLSDWYRIQHTAAETAAVGKRPLSTITVNSEIESTLERRNLAVDYVYCMALKQILQQLYYHPGHDDLINKILNQCFCHFKFKEDSQSGPNATNLNQVADMYAKVVGKLAEARFALVRRKFHDELRTWRSRERDPSGSATAFVNHSIISLLMGMKFFRVAMHPIEEFEAGFAFLNELANYFIEIKDKDIKHALAGLFVEILLPVAASVKNEVNIPILKTFVETLYSVCSDMAIKRKHNLALFPLVTCLLSVSQKSFFLNHWPTFLTMCLSHLKLRDAKMARVALESLFRLLWVYIVRIKCEKHTDTQSKLQSIVSSLFPKGSKLVIPKDAPMNIFVRIIHFIAQEKLDFAMKEIIFELLCVNRAPKVIMPERMNIGLCAFLVIAHSLQQKEGEPPMPEGGLSGLQANASGGSGAAGVVGGTMRVKRSLAGATLTDAAASSLGIQPYMSQVRLIFHHILTQLDTAVGKPLMLTKPETSNKEAVELLTGERKPKLDLLKTCIGAIPRLLPERMNKTDLVELLSRLTVHLDQEVQRLAVQALQNLVLEFPVWRHRVVRGYVQFIHRELSDSAPQLLDVCLRMLAHLLKEWRNGLVKDGGLSSATKAEEKAALTDAEGLALVMLCHCRKLTRQFAVFMLREVRSIAQTLLMKHTTCIEVMDSAAPTLVQRLLPNLPASERHQLASWTSPDFGALAGRDSPLWLPVAATEPVSGTPALAGSVSAATSCSGLISSVHPTDPWPSCLAGVLSVDYLLTQCPGALRAAWPLLFERLQLLFHQFMDPTLALNETRASLLRAGSKKPSNERELFMPLWHNYVVMACALAPSSTGVRVERASRSLSPEGTSLSSSSHGDMLTSLVGEQQQRIAVERDAERVAERQASMAYSMPYNASHLFKLLVPILRCELPDLRTSVVSGLGRINPAAFRDALDELQSVMKEARDLQSKENVRRKGRRNALRAALVRIFELMAHHEVFHHGEAGVVCGAQRTLIPVMVEYLEGMRAYLQSEKLSDLPQVQEIRLHFSGFLRHLVRHMPRDMRNHLLSKNVRAGLFALIQQWTGKFGKAFAVQDRRPSKDDQCSEMEFSAIAALAALLCCGSAFEADVCFIISKTEHIYSWLDTLLLSHEQKVAALGHETVVLLLDFNPHEASLLEWVIDRCYTGGASDSICSSSSNTSELSDACFLALVKTFNNSPEYQCDHVAMINVALMYTGCPRVSMQERATQLLQLLYHRFYVEHRSTLEDQHHELMDEEDEGNEENDDSGRRDHGEDENVLPRHQLQSSSAHAPSKTEALWHALPGLSQMDISCRLALLHPGELTMPIFSEITQRLETATPWARHTLLQYLVPWLERLELIDPNVKQINTDSLSAYLQRVQQQSLGHGASSAFGTEVWGSREATDMLLNNLLYMTVRYGDNHPAELEVLWGVLVRRHTTNLKIILRYLLIVTSLAPTELLAYTKRIVIFLGRARPERLVDELMSELQAVDGAGYSVERTQTPPYFRLTCPIVGKGKAVAVSVGTDHGGESSGTQPANEDETCSTYTVLAERAEPPLVASGFLKRHSVQDADIEHLRQQCGTLIAQSAPGSLRTPSGFKPHIAELDQEALDDLTCGSATPSEIEYSGDKYATLRPRDLNQLACRVADQLPHSSAPQPLPMPAYGGYFAPLHMFLPDATLPSIAFYRSGVVLMLLSDLVLDLADMDWGVHLPLILHCVLLGMDHSRVLVHEQCKRLLLNLLIALSRKSEFFRLAALNLSSSGTDQQFVLTVDGGPCATMIRTALSDEISTSALSCAYLHTSNSLFSLVSIATLTPESTATAKQLLAAAANKTPPSKGQPNAATLLADYLANHRGQPLWTWEDISPRNLRITSAVELEQFVQSTLHIFNEAQPTSHLEQRWCQMALNTALSCSSRHYACRSLQVFRALHVPLNNRSLADILQRLIETVADVNEDMQGYVCELLLTLETAVDYLDAEFSTLNILKDLFKSTPNLAPNMAPSRSHNISDRSAHHARSTSYTAGVASRKRFISSASSDGGALIRGRPRTMTEAEMRPLNRSQSSQSIDSMELNAEDKLNIVSQLFWLAASLLESDFEHEFSGAVRLLDRLFQGHLEPTRADHRERLDKMLQQIEWCSYPGLLQLLLKGLSCAALCEPTWALLARLVPHVCAPVIEGGRVDGTLQDASFATLTLALLPGMMHQYESQHGPCREAAGRIAAMCGVLVSNGKLDNLATVMSLYERAAFSKDSSQWTKCVVKYLLDGFVTLGPHLMQLAVTLLDRGAPLLQCHLLDILFYLLHYVDISSKVCEASGQRLVLILTTRHLEQREHWKSAQRILKLCVSKSAVLTAPPLQKLSEMPLVPLPEAEAPRVELPGRVLDFRFDVQQVPLIASSLLEDHTALSTPPTVSTIPSSTATTTSLASSSGAGSAAAAAAASRRRVSVSSCNVATPSSSSGSSATTTAVAAVSNRHSAAFFSVNKAAAEPVEDESAPVTLSVVPSSTQCSSLDNSPAWRRPWLCQSRVRDRLLHLCAAFGQRAGLLPKSPSVIFSQSTETIDRQPSVNSSSETTSTNEASANDELRFDDTSSAELRHQQAQFFRDFDRYLDNQLNFLELEDELADEEDQDHAERSCKPHWGVRRESITHHRNFNTNDHERDTEDGHADPSLSMRHSSSFTARDDSSEDDIEPEADADCELISEAAAEMIGLMQSGSHDSPSARFHGAAGVSDIEVSSGKAALNRIGGSNRDDFDTTPTRESTEVFEYDEDDMEELESAPTSAAPIRSSGLSHRSDAVLCWSERGTGTGASTPSSRLEAGSDSDVSPACSPGEYVNVVWPRDAAGRVGTGSSSTCGSGSAVLVTSRITPICTDEAELLWLSLTDRALREPVTDSSMEALGEVYAVFPPLAREALQRLAALTKESNYYLARLSGGAVGLHFVRLCDALTEGFGCPFVFAAPDALSGAGRTPRWNLLLLRDSYETFKSARDVAESCLDEIKNSIRLNGADAASESVRFNNEEQKVKLCRNLFRLHLQLITLYETYHKAVEALRSAAPHDGDESEEVGFVAKELAIELSHLVATERSPPASVPPVVSRAELESKLADHLEASRFNAAARLFAAARSQWFFSQLPQTGSPEDELHLLLRVYCRHLWLKDRPNLFVIISATKSFSTFLEELTELHVTLSASISELERQTRFSRDLLFRPAESSSL